MRLFCRFMILYDSQFPLLPSWMYLRRRAKETICKHGMRPVGEPFWRQGWRQSKMEEELGLVRSYQSSYLYQLTTV